MELSCFDFSLYTNWDFQMLQQILCLVWLLCSTKLKESHCSLTLVHPGFTRLAHYVRAKNLPFSIDDVRSVVNNCSSCCKIKPRFYRNQKDKHLICATVAFLQLNVDYKGPLPESVII